MMAVDMSIKNLIGVINSPSTTSKFKGACRSELVRRRVKTEVVETKKGPHIPEHLGNQQFITYQHMKVIYLVFN